MAKKRKYILLTAKVKGMKGPRKIPAGKYTGMVTKSKNGYFTLSLEKTR